MRRTNQPVPAREDQQIRLIRVSRSPSDAQPADPPHRYVDLGPQQPAPEQQTRLGLRDLQASVRELDEQVRDKQSIHLQMKRETLRVGREFDQASAEGLEMKKRLAELYRKNSQSEAEAREKIKAIAHASNRVDELRRELSSMGSFC